MTAWPPELRDTATTIATCESGLNPLAAHVNPNLSIDLTFPGQPTPDLLAVQDQWKKIGVTLNIVPATSTDQKCSPHRPGE